MMRIETDRRAKLYCTTTSLVSFSVLVRAATRQRIKSSQWTPSPDQNIYHKNKLMIILNYTLLLYRLFVQVSRYIYTNLQPLQGIRSQKKSPQQYSAKWKAACTRLTAIWLKKTDFITTKLPIQETYDTNVQDQLHLVLVVEPTKEYSDWSYIRYATTLKYQSHPLHKLWPPTQKGNCKSVLAWNRAEWFCPK